jgi:hypothetical protein
MENSMPETQEVNQAHHKNSRRNMHNRAISNSYKPNIKTKRIPTKKTTKEMETLHKHMPLYEKYNQNINSKRTMEKSPIHFKYTPNTTK